MAGLYAYGLVGRAAVLLAATAAVMLGVASLMAAWSMNHRTIAIGSRGVFRHDALTGVSSTCFYGYDTEPDCRVQGQRPNRFQKYVQAAPPADQAQSAAATAADAAADASQAAGDAATVAAVAAADDPFSKFDRAEPSHD